MSAPGLMREVTEGEPIKKTEDGRAGSRPVPVRYRDTTLHSQQNSFLSSKRVPTVEREREAEGRLRLETADDGTSWNESLVLSLHSQDTPSALSYPKTPRAKSDPGHTQWRLEKSSVLKRSCR